jgi:DNA repair protein RecN (Recombination protein N)
MLEELSVAGLGAIDHAEVTLGPGLSALTGETGAGKTLLVAALGLLTGERADRSRVREGAAEAVVEGRFRVPAAHAVVDLLLEHELVDPDGDEAEIVITRIVPADSKPARARINGRMVTAAVLAEVGALLVEIAGQHEQRSLAGATAQRSMLDAFAGAEAVRLAGEVRMAVRAATAAERELEVVEAGERERARELDILRFEVTEIEAAAPVAGESDRLKTDASRLEHASTIAGALAAARRALKSDGGAVEQAAEASSRIAEAAALDPSLAELHKRIEDAVYELEDIAASAGAIELDTDPGALDRLRDRLGELNRLQRKYGADESDVLAYLEKARARLIELESTTDSIERLRAEAVAAKAEAEKLAARLGKVRSEAAGRLRAAIEPLLADLALAGARFEVELQPTELYEGGAEKVGFLVAANPGESPRPLGKVASGGELSRIALSLHVLTGSADAPTLVFDEVDAGVGGEAAQAVGRALARLGEESEAQVLVVTHLPQVASWADAQYRVAKKKVASRASVSVERVEGAERVEELSRMLAGMPESDKARLHAEELLEIAGQSR